MATRLTSFSKFLIVMVIVGAIGYLLYNSGVLDDLQNQNTNDNVEQSTENTTNKSAATHSSRKDDDALTVQIFTWGGYAPGLYFNEGARWSKNSRFYKEYGLKVNFELIDDFDGSRNAWIADEVDLLGNEVSAMNTEMERLAPHNPRILLQCDWSRGGDAVVVARGINSVNDLRGKKIAYAGFTPSVSFLIYMLESAGMKMSDVQAIEVPLPTDAANAFKSGKVDAAIVWSPDDLVCVRNVPGSKVLQSTKEASHIIADVFMVKDKYVRENADKLAKFYEGWMKAAAEINAEASNKQKAGKILAEVTGLPMADAIGMMDNVRLTNHGDNLDFFGLNIDHKGITGEQLYNKMGAEFERLKQAPANRPAWRALAYAKPAQVSKLVGAQHRSEGAKKFEKATPAYSSKKAIATKPVTINFNTGQYKLTENAKTIIDLQFSEIARVYGNTRIRVEGNTDNVGKAAMNKALSKKRAQSVANYLINQYQMSPNRIMVVGNGSDKPVIGCEQNQNSACKSKNRRTDFQLVAD